MNKSIIDIVSDYVGWERSITTNIAGKSPYRYRIYRVNKKNGGTRIIFHPSTTTKALQYAIMKTLLYALPVHNSALAYKPALKSPIRTNAENHLRYKYTIRIDIKEFFPSIKPSDLIPIINKHITKLIPNRENDLSDEEKQFLQNALFVSYKSKSLYLAIGAPSSPFISNVVLFNIDKIFQSYASANSDIYTRYADDFFYSTNGKGQCSEFLNYAETTFKNCKSPKLVINKDKTLFMSDKNRRIITGLFITSDRKISIGRKQKRYIKKLVFDLITGKLDENLKGYLEGYLNYVRDVEPSFWNALNIKYGSFVDKLWSNDQ